MRAHRSVVGVVLTENSAANKAILAGETTSPNLVPEGFDINPLTSKAWYDLYMLKARTR
jgi:hypothetical protein